MVAAGQLVEGFQAVQHVVDGADLGAGQGADLGAGRRSGSTLLVGSPLGSRAAGAGPVRAEVTALRPATEASAAQGPPNDAPPQVVWVLQRWDRHADEISLNSDEACTLAEPARHVRTGVHAV